jgi:hypothetical protein
MENRMPSTRTSSFVPSKVYTRTLLTGSVLVGLGLLVAYGFYRQQQEAAAQRAIVQTVCSLVDLPEGTSPDSLYAALSCYSGQREEARRARIARMAGIEPNWSRILQRIERAGKARRAEFYQAMAKEYGLPETWSSKEIATHVLSEENRPRVTGMVELLPQRGHD